MCMRIWNVICECEATGGPQLTFFYGLHITFHKTQQALACRQVKEEEDDMMH